MGAETPAPTASKSRPERPSTVAEQGAEANAETLRQFADQLLRDQGFQGPLEQRQRLQNQANAALKEEPSNADGLIVVAMLALPDGDRVDDNGDILPTTATALKNLEAAIEADPRRIEAMRQLGKLYELIAPDKAIEMWELALRHDPHDLDTRNNLGEGYLKNGQPEPALKLARKSIEFGQARSSEEQLRKAYNIVGTALAMMGRYQEAERFLKKALVNRDGSHWNCAYQALGILYSKLGTAHDDPFQEFEPLHPNPLDSSATFSAALRSYYAHRIDDAQGFITQSLNHDISSHAMVVAGFLDISTQNYQGARVHFSKAQQLSPDELGAAVGKGHLAIIEQDYSSARALLEPAVERWLKVEVSSSAEPDYLHFIHRMACLGMGWLLANQNQHNEAIVWFDRVLAHRPFDVLAKLGRGNSLIGLNNMNQAETELNEVLDIEPRNPYARAELASIYLSRGEVERAEQGFEQALKVHDKGYTCPYEGLGMVYLKQGRIEKARENFQKAIELNPDIEYKKFNGLARIYIGEGRHAEARKLLKRSIANYPYDDEAKTLLQELGP